MGYAEPVLKDQGGRKGFNYVEVRKAPYSLHPVGLMLALRSTTSKTSSKRCWYPCSRPL